MLIVAGLSLKNLQPRVWDPSSPFHIPALAAVMDSCALILVGVEEMRPLQARMTFAMARQVGKGIRSRAGRDRRGQAQRENRAGEDGAKKGEHVLSWERKGGIGGDSRQPIAEQTEQKSRYLQLFAASIAKGFQS